VRRSGRDATRRANCGIDSIVAQPARPKAIIRVAVATRCAPHARRAWAIAVRRSCVSPTAVPAGSASGRARARTRAARRRRSRRETKSTASHDADRGSRHDLQLALGVVQTSATRGAFIQLLRRHDRCACRPPASRPRAALHRRCNDTWERHDETDRDECTGWRDHRPPSRSASGIRHHDEAAQLGERGGADARPTGFTPVTFGSVDRRLSSDFGSTEPCWCRQLARNSPETLRSFAGRRDPGLLGRAQSTQRDGRPCWPPERHPGGGDGQPQHNSGRVPAVRQAHTAPQFSSPPRLWQLASTGLPSHCQRQIRGQDLCSSASSCT
jgi:hypothetical protein